MRIKSVDLGFWTRHRVCVFETRAFEFTVFRVVWFKVKISSDKDAHIGVICIQFLYLFEEPTNLLKPSVLALLQRGNDLFEVLTSHLSRIHVFVNFLYEECIPLDTGVQMETHREKFSARVRILDLGEQGITKLTRLKAHVVVAA